MKVFFSKVVKLKNHPTRLCAIEIRDGINRLRSAYSDRFCATYEKEDSDIFSEHHRVAEEFARAFKIPGTLETIKMDNKEETFIHLFN